MLFILGVLVGSIVGFFAAALMAAADSQMPIDVVDVQSPAGDRLGEPAVPVV